MKKKLILVLFGLIDILLILGIIYIVKRTDLLRQASQAGEPASAAVSEGEVYVTDTAEDNAYLAYDTEDTAEDAYLAYDYDTEDAAGDEYLAYDDDTESPAADDPDTFYLYGTDADSLVDFDSAVDEKEWDDLFAADLSAGSVPEDTEEISEVLTDISEIMSEAEATEPPADDAAAISELSPTRRCLVDGTFWEGCPPRDIQLLTPNPYSRPQYALEEVHDIVIHYVGNAGSTAQQNRDYFESLQDGSRSASSHFVVGLDGEIIQCVSCSEWSYATNNRNFDTISIECCHPDDSGKFNDATYWSTVDLTAWLCKAFEIGPEHVIRHYDVTGKNCPKYYVENEDAWYRMLDDIRARYNEYMAE